MLNIRFEDNERTAISDTFKVTIPLLPAQHYWEDGVHWEAYDPGSQDFIVLCSPACDPLAFLSKTASQEEAEAFLARNL
jgi:hypothetical protein